MKLSVRGIDISQYGYEDDYFRYEYGPWRITSKSYKMATKWGVNQGFSSTMPRLSCNHETNAGSSTAAIAQLAFFYNKGGFAWNPDMTFYKGDDSNLDVSEESISILKSAYKSIASNSIVSYGCTSTSCANYNKTVTNFAKINSTLYSLGFSVSQVDVPLGPDFPLTDFFSRLRAGQAIFMSGANNVKQTRYYWVADGFANAVRTISIYDKFTGKYMWSVEDDTTEPEILHCNMGYNGSSNGFYYFGTFNLEFPLVSDNSRIPVIKGQYPDDITYITVVK